MAISLPQRAAIRRGADPGRVLGAGLGAGLAASSLSFSTETGLLTIDPLTAIPGLVLLIGELTGLIPSFAGKPKLLDTIQAVQRLAQSSNPAIQQLAKNIGIYAKNGVPLSTSNPQQQAQIRGWIGGAVNTILQQRGIAPNAQNVGLLDQSIRNVLTSEIANSGRHIDAAIAQLGGGGGGAAPAPVGLSARQPGLRRPLTTPIIVRNAPQPQPGAPQLPEDTPGEVRQLFHQATEYLSTTEIGQLAKCLFVNWKHGPEAAAYCLEELLAHVVSQGGKQIIGAIQTYARQLGQALRGQPRIPGPQPGGPAPGLPVPILDQTSDCPSCTPRGRLQKQLQEQETRTLRDIEREQGQLTEQQLSQQSQELSRLEQFETQPAGQRDIPKELQRKQQVLQQIRNEEYQLGGQPAPQQPGQPEFPTPSQPAPQLQPQSQQNAQHEIEQELHDQHDHVPVQFCVGCKSQEDAILFLNGEPSQCSVIPGSTKETNYG